LLDFQYCILHYYQSMMQYYLYRRHMLQHFQVYILHCPNYIRLRFLDYNHQELVDYMHLQIQYYNLQCYFQ